MAVSVLRYRGKRYKHNHHFQNDADMSSEVNTDTHALHCDTKSDMNFRTHKLLKAIRTLHIIDVALFASHPRAAPRLKHGIKGGVTCITALTT